jgi:hypothetical protein
MLLHCSRSFSGIVLSAHDERLRRPLRGKAPPFREAGGGAGEWGRVASGRQSPSARQAAEGDKTRCE